MLRNTLRMINQQDQWFNQLRREESARRTLRYSLYQALEQVERLLESDMMEVPIEMQARLRQIVEAVDPQLIPVSAWWDGTHLVIATTGASRTAQNMNTNRLVRVAGGSPSDAIMIDADVVERSAVEDSPELAGGFAGAVGWDPRDVGRGW